jgi:hypothetical protein
MGKVSAQTKRANQLLLEAILAPEKLPSLPPSDWDLLLRVARRVRLLGRLEADLSSAGLLGEIPAKAAEHLRAARTVIDHRRTLVTWEINRLLWALEGNHGPLVLLKGAAYMMAGLPPAPGRLFADIDLLAPERRVTEVEERLVLKGWYKTEIEAYDDRYYRVWMHEIPPLRHRERGTEIDIHHRILPRTSRLKPDPALLLEAARPLADPRLHILAPADLVLHAVVHLFLEGDPEEGLRFRDLLDVHLLLRHYGQEPGFWEGLVPRARRLGLLRPLYYALRFTRLLFAAEIPPKVREEINGAKPHWPVSVLMDYLVPLALLPGHPDHPHWQATSARWLLYMRAHWLKMPPLMLARHLLYKAYLRVRGINKKIDLTQLDLRQQ